MTLRERTTAERDVEVRPDELVMGRLRSSAGIGNILEDRVVVGETLPRPRIARAESEVTRAIVRPECELLRLEGRVERQVVERIVRGDLEVCGQERVVLHVLADIREVNNRLDAECPRLVRGANTGEEH